MNYTTIISLIKNYRWRSFFVRYFFITFIPFLILFMIISNILFNNYLKSMRYEAQKRSKRILANISYSVENVFRAVDNCYYNILVNEDMQYFLATSKVYDLDFAKITRALQKYMGAFTNVNDTIQSLYVYGRQSNFILSSSSLVPSAPFDRFEDMQWYKNEASKSKVIFSRQLNLGFTKRRLLTVCIPLFYGRNIDGYFVANIDYNKLKQICNSNYDANSAIYLVDKNGSILLSSEDIKSNNIKDYDLLYESYLNMPKDKVEAVTYKNNSIITAMSVQDTELGIILKYNITGDTYQNRLNSINSVLIILALFLVAVVISLLLTFKFYNAIFDILQILQNPDGSKNFSDKNDELNFINRSILSIIDRNNAIEHELVQKIVMLNKAQAMSLQSQLNPHFIFNTIHLISTLEMKAHKCETDVTAAIRLFADILRVVLDTTEIFVTLDKEIEYSKKYLEIVNLRYTNKVKIQWDIDQNTTELYVLKLSLQPILENAINHGLSPLKKDRVLGIAAKRSNGRLVITISDNGIGMDYKTLNEVRASMDSKGLERKMHLGLNNINQRIKLIFGDRYGCKIYSDMSGTTVEMKIPIIDSMNKICTYNKLGGIVNE